MEDAQEENDFAEMTRIAARDGSATGAKVSLQQARSGSTSLLVAAGLYFLMGAACMLPRGLFWDEPWTAWVGGLYLLAPVVFVGLYGWARRDPFPATLVGLAVYAALLVPTMTLVIAIDLWLVELMILIALVDALRAAIQYRRFRQKAALPPGVED